MTRNKSIVAWAVLVAAFVVTGCDSKCNTKEEPAATKIDKPADKTREVVKEGASDAAEDKTKNVVR